MTVYEYYVEENYNNEQINLHVNSNNFLNDDFDLDYSDNEDELHQEEEEKDVLQEKSDILRYMYRSYVFDIKLQVVQLIFYFYIEYIKTKY